MSYQSENPLLRVKKEAFKQVFHTWHKPLCFFASRIVKDPDLAEDLVQDVFLAFWDRDLSAFPNEKAIKTFLFNSVQNRCIDYFRAQECRERNKDKVAPKIQYEQDCFLFQQIEAEVTAELFRAVNELPDRCREIFCLAYLQEKEEKEIAELLHISINTVKTQKQRAKLFLKTRLGELFIFAGVFFPGL